MEHEIQQIILFVDYKRSMVKYTGFVTSWWQWWDTLVKSILHLSAYRIPYSRREVVKKELDEMLKQISSNHPIALGLHPLYWSTRKMAPTAFALTIGS